MGSDKRRKQWSWVPWVNLEGLLQRGVLSPAWKKDMVIGDWRMLELCSQCTCRGQRVALIPGLRKGAKGTWLQLKALERQWQHLFSLNARHPVPTTVGHFTGSWMNEVCMSLQSPVIVLKKKKNSLHSCVTLAQTLSLHRDSEPLPAATSPPTGLQAQEHPHWAYNPPGTFPPPLHVHAKYCPWRLHGLLRCFIRAWIKCHSFRGVSADHPSWNSPRCPLLTPHSASLASTAFITTWHHVKL